MDLTDTQLAILALISERIAADGVWHRHGPVKFDDGDAQGRLQRWVVDFQKA